MYKQQLEEMLDLFGVDYSRVSVLGADAEINRLENLLLEEIDKIRAECNRRLGQGTFEAAAVASCADGTAPLIAEARLAYLIDMLFDCPLRDVDSFLASNPVFSVKSLEAFLGLEEE
jgi:hypothetical protein